MKITRIYVLRDPRTEQIRYVGKTEETLSQRLYDHVYEAKRDHGCDRCIWIRELVTLCLQPVIELLEECSAVEWQKRERFWIEYGRTSGWNLTNSSDGGEGCSGYHLTDEQKAKLSAANKVAQNRPETKAAKSVALLGNKNGVGNGSSTGMKPSSETIARIAEKNRGQTRSDAQRANISNSKKNRSNGRNGYVTSDEVKEKIRQTNLATWARKKLEQEPNQ